MDGLTERVPGQIMEFCLIHNPNVSLVKISDDDVNIVKEGDTYILNVSDSSIDITENLDKDVLENLVNGSMEAIYYAYRIYDEDYVLLSIIDYFNPITETKAYIDIVHQAYNIYANYHKIESIYDAMEYFCREVMNYNASLPDDRDDLYIQLDERDDDTLSANAAWARFSATIQFPLLQHTDF